MVSLTLQDITASFGFTRMRNTKSAEYEKCCIRRMPNTKSAAFEECRIRKVPHSKSAAFEKCRIQRNTELSMCGLRITNWCYELQLELHHKNTNYR